MVIQMQKEKNAIKIISVLIILFVLDKAYSQEQLNGNYSSLAQFQEFYDFYNFNKNGVFEYHTGADLGDDYFGKGEYKIENDNLILNYNKTSPLKLGYYLTEIWTNNKDSINVNITTITLDKKPAPYLSITFSDSLAKNGVNGIATDRDGSGSITFKKDRKNINLSLTGVGYCKLPIFRTALK